MFVSDVWFGWEDTRVFCVADKTVYDAPERMSSNFQLHQWSELLVSERFSKIWIHYLEKFPPLLGYWFTMGFYKTPNFHQFPWDIGDMID